MRILLPLALVVLLPTTLTGQPLSTLDLLTAPTSEGLMRIYGSESNGWDGLPVAGGQDLDGDDEADFAIGSMKANVTSPEVRAAAGQVFVVFGDGSISGTVDTAIAGTQGSRVLRILGGTALEHAGSELWVDDVTGDGKADLLVCRQDHDPGSRSGAGALTIVAGGADLKVAAQQGIALDLADPDPMFTITTIVGADAEDRVCIWARTGDIDGDGTKDIALGADRRSVYSPLQTCLSGAEDNGVVYVVRGGAHLGSGDTHDLDQYGNGGFGLAGNLAEIRPPRDGTNACNWHFGATVAVGDLDGNGRAEVLGAAALERSGAALSPNGGGDNSGGPPFGRVVIVWDDRFPQTPWSHPYVFEADDVPAWRTEIAGASLGGGIINEKLGEEMLAGFDFNGEGGADLFLGDITGRANGIYRAGLGVVLYDVADLKGESFSLNALPEGLEMTLILGPSNTAISSDTAAAPDIQGDGISDLAIGTPMATPGSRTRAGVAHVLVGKAGGWPLWPGQSIDLAALPPSGEVEIHQIDGAESWDMIFYSAASADVDGDGREDLLFNEMTGDAPSGDDVGNLIVLTGAWLVGLLLEDGFEDGTLDAWNAQFP